jgi:hypothetical protein
MSPAKAQDDGITDPWANLSAFLELVFGFVLDLTEQKGKTNDDSTVNI